jgi:hypothetical protein
VAPFHLSVTQLPNPDGSVKLVYDRKLRPGAGLSTYGLEVCEALLHGTDRRLIERAKIVRDHLVERAATQARAVAEAAARAEAEAAARVPQPGERSRYSAQVRLSRCPACGVAAADQTHHIRFQRDQDADGHVAPGVHVHRASNLTPLCDACHTQVHTGALCIRGYRQTTEGTELVVLPAEAPTDDAAAASGGIGIGIASGCSAEADANAEADAEAEAEAEAEAKRNPFDAFRCKLKLMRKPRFT